MDRNWLTIISSFAMLFLLQVFIFNHINLGLYISVYAYILFIINLPTHLSRLNVLLLSSAMGLSLDLFSSNIIGPHFIACILTGYLRPFYIKMVVSNSDYQADIPRFKRNDIGAYLMYVGLIVFTHLLVLFWIDTLDFTQFFYILFRSLLSTFVSIIFITLLGLFYKKGLN